MPLPEYAGGMAALPAQLPAPQSAAAFQLPPGFAQGFQQGMQPQPEPIDYGNPHDAQSAPSFNANGSVNMREQFGLAPDAPNADEHPAKAGARDYVATLMKGIGKNKQMDEAAESFGKDADASIPGMIGSGLGAATSHLLGNPLRGDD